MTEHRTDRMFSRVDADVARGGAEQDRVNLLIVDDRADNLLALEGILKDLGQNIVKANSGQEALGVAFNHDFAVILLDVRMPDMDGFETAELIRRRKRSAHTPIIFVTAVDDTQRHVAQGYAAGAVDYIFKPFLPEVLKAKVGVFIELYKKRRQLERSEARYRALVENIPGAIYQCTAENPRRMQFISDPIEAMTGHSAAEFVDRGLTLLEIVHPDDRPIVREMVEGALREKRPYAMDYRILAKDGQVRWVFDKGQAILNENGKILCFDGLIFDITDRKTAERVLRERTHELESRNRELDAFSYSVSHDLRAPLRAIHRFTEILMTEDLKDAPAGAQDSMKRILDASAHMDALIEDLLEYSRLTRAEITLQPLDVAALAAEVKGHLAVTIQERKAEVSVGACPRMVGDPVLLSQVLTNLFTNAIKFVPAGKSPRIVVRGERREGSPIVRLWVEDNGIGIEPEYQERIFRVFERLHQRETYPGTGIGLAIVQRAMERMDGRVGVESTPGKGSRFWIELPAPREEAP